MKAYVQRIRILGMMYTDHMKLQIATLRELISAQITMIGLFSCMSAIMLLKQIFKSKTFSTNITLKSMFILTHNES